MPRPVLVKQGEIDSAESARFVILKKKLEAFPFRYVPFPNPPPSSFPPFIYFVFTLFFNVIGIVLCGSATKQNVVGEAMLIKAFESGKETYSNPRKKLLKSYAIK
ncbi:hypothetical protein IFM89_028749 [Coptis chinensis]|uniref:Uncharacterized protein n=1 Tax=Coptis chinensis TaxID=261450 RepID=A0A835GYI9_9MAGN|nr:hypothetical protein IFM89_028749 [Coptis chinensis]